MVAAILTSLLITAIVLMLAFPETPAARSIRRVLVERPGNYLSDLTWAKTGKLLLSGVLILVMVMMGPEAIALLAAAGADAAMIEVLILVWLAAMSGGLVAAWRPIGRAAAKLMRGGRRVAARRRQRAPRRQKTRRPPNQPDDADPDWIFAS